MSTHLPATDDEDLELPRRSRLPIVAVLLVALVIGVGIVALAQQLAGAVAMVVAADR